MDHAGSHVGSLAVSDILARGSIRGEDVARLARDVLADGIVDAAEAETLIEMHAACGVQDSAWPPFFVDAITDYIVHQAPPEGYVNAVNARWLLTAIAPGGLVRTRAGLDLLVNVLDSARWAPVSLSRCALEQILRAVRCGDGPLRADRAVPAGVITAAEIALVRRILCAFGSDGHVAITRAEAEVLFEIDAALASENVDQEWCALFGGALANVALTASGYAVPTRDAALAVATVADAAAGASARLDAYLPQSREERALARLERQRIEIITNEEILGEEGSWLAERFRTLVEPGCSASPAVHALMRILASHSDAIGGDLREALAIAQGRSAAAA